MEAQVMSPAQPGAAFLPDFCRGGAVLSVLVITELVAILITLVALDASVLLWERFLLLSLYLQWIGITSAAGLCLIRRRAQALSGLAVAGLCYLLLLLITILFSELAWRLAVYQDLFPVLQMSHAEFLVRNLGVCAMVAALALRYFWVQHQWQQQALAVGNARFQALQARIRPHFLFNSLNSIAELAAARPSEAETAVEDLATLLRATLDEHDQPVSLASELALTQAYLRIESQRLGPRLQVDWRVDDSLLDQRIPPLSLQPLVENAVRHGIEPLAEGGRIEIEAKAQAKAFVITVRNPVGTVQSVPGTGEALSNIRQRLQFLYHEQQADLELQQHDGYFVVRLRLPRTGVET